jgi:hypothetical protein
MGRPLKPIQYGIFPCLREKMKLACASVVALSEAAGTSTRPINRVLAGKRTRADLGVYLYEALNSRIFNKSPRGKKL